jgi:hypothetical protein
MTEQKETENIWKTIKDAEMLRDLYGYYPTFSVEKSQRGSVPNVNDFLHTINFAFGS